MYECVECKKRTRSLEARYGTVDPTDCVHDWSIESERSIDGIHWYEYRGYYHSLG